jgi:hypothetical protein
VYARQCIITIITIHLIFAQAVIILVSPAILLVLPIASPAIPPITETRMQAPVPAIMGFMMGEVQLAYIVITLV